MLYGRAPYREVAFAWVFRWWEHSYDLCYKASCDPYVEPEELAEIKAKTLVIAGTKDMIKKEHTIQISSGIPGSELVFIEGDHFIANKCPDEFNRIVLSFLQG